MAGIAIVTDSTCDYGPERLGKMGVTMVPLKVHFGDDTYRDWVDLTPVEFYPKLLSSSVLPTTSQPSPREFSEVYARLADEGCEGIVSIHLSAKLSGTIESATIAAKECSVPVRVVDSLVVSGAIGLVVEDACAARDAGGDLDAVEKAAHTAVDSIELLFVLDTLDYLVKGGRAGKVQGMAASLLSIKPILQLKDGLIVPFAKAKGTRKAYQLLAEYVAKRSHELGGVRAVIVESLAGDRVQQLNASLGSAGVDGEVHIEAAIGSVIGTHVGPKAVGVAFLPKT